MTTSTVDAIKAQEEAVLQQAAAIRRRRRGRTLRERRAVEYWGELDAAERLGVNRDVMFRMITRGLEYRGTPGTPDARYARHTVERLKRILDAEAAFETPTRDWVPVQAIHAHAPGRMDLQSFVVLLDKCGVRREEPDTAYEFSRRNAFDVWRLARLDPGNGRHSHYIRLMDRARQSVDGPDPKPVA